MCCKFCFVFSEYNPDPDDTSMHEKASQHLNENGYVVFQNAFPVDEIKDLKAEFEKMKPHYQESTFQNTNWHYQ